MTGQDFIKKHSYDIIKASLGSNLFASVFMAQAYLESNKGNSSLAQNYNNLFGIKAGSSWTGKTVQLPTTEVLSGQSIKVDSSFRVYNSTTNSINDRAELLIKNYPEVLAANTAENQAIALGNSTYATDPDYSNKLLKIMNDNNLLILDQKKKKMKNIEIIAASLGIILALITLYKHFKTA